MSVAKITIAGDEHYASDTRPVVFGRAGVAGVVGLDARDKGISAMAGSVEWKGLWFVVNRSRKRKLHIDDGAGGGPQPLDCGQLRVVNASPLRIEVRGDIRTHPIGVSVPDEDLARYAGNAISTGTLLPEIWLDEDDRAAVVALFRGYLLPAPRCQPWPRTYAEAARWLEEDWTATALRKRIERLKLRLSRTGPPFEGQRANHDLAEYLIINNVIGPEDLSPGASGGGAG